MTTIHLLLSNSNQTSTEKRETNYFW